MAELEIAHINEQGEDIILIPLNNTFGYKTRLEQEQTITSLQNFATRAGLKGKVIPVWVDVAKRMHFVAPEFYHAFMFSINYNYVLRNINKKLVCE
jgi:hypothetical protein